MNPLITIIVPAYNVEKYIDRCINSIINQSYQNLQVIIVNDGSTDNTWEKCQRYEDKRIEIVGSQMLKKEIADTPDYVKVMNPTEWLLEVIS